MAQGLATAVFVVLASAVTSGVAAAQTYLRCTPDDMSDYFVILNTTWRLEADAISYLDPNTAEWSNLCADSTYSLAASCTVTADAFRAETTTRRTGGRNFLSISRRTGVIEYSTPERTQRGKCQVTEEPAQAAPIF
jgi:hypothetical protein